MFDKDYYGKIIVPMVTPFKQDQSVDYKAAVSIGEKLVKENKSDSILLTGTTGEFFSMNFDERLKMFEVMKEALGEKIPLIAGTGCGSTKETIELSKKAEELGFNLIMVVAPYFTRPNQEQLFNHYKKIAEEINISIMLYNIPIFAGVNLNKELVKKLSFIDNIIGIKDETELNVKQTTEFINATPDDFLIYSGDDTMMIETYAQGGKERIGGVVSGGAHLIGERIRKMIEIFQNGNVEEAAKMQRSFFPLYKVLVQNDRYNPVSLLKDAMNMIGYEAGIPRLPLSPGSEEEKKEVRKVMSNLNLI